MDKTYYMGSFGGSPKSLNLEKSRAAFQALKESIDNISETMTRDMSEIFEDVREWTDTSGHAYIATHDGKNRHERRKEAKLSRKKR